MKRVMLIAAASAALTVQAEELSPDTIDVVDRFLGSYCLECHDSASTKGERDFEVFGLPLQDIADLISAQEIVDQVTLKEMPPKEAEQPTEEERLAVVRALRAGIADARGRIDSTGGRTVLRRLTHREYENTLETLFDRRVDTLGLTAEFPKEKTSHHLDTIGESLVTSGFLLDNYFAAANRLVELRLGEAEREPKSWHFTRNFIQYEELQGSHKSAFDFDFLCLYEQPNTDTRQGGYGHIEDFLDGVPASGLYDIEVLVKAMHRDTHYDPEIFRIDLSEPFQLAVVPGDVTKGHIHYPQAIEPELARSVVPDDKFEWIKLRVWLEEGQTPRFIFPNGPFESRASVLTINKRYKDEFEGKISDSGVSRTHILRQGALPHIRIDEIKIHGPIAEEGGSREEKAIFGPEGFSADKARDQLHGFAERAFRRPLEKADRERIAAFHQQRLDEKASARQAALDTVKMILCSPSFLYLGETTPEEEPLLRPHDLAARLSYALWAAPPDSPLRDAATDGSILEPEVLEKHVLRMLEDERSKKFVEGFLDAWLNLRDLGGMPPPRDQFREYYGQNLPASMKAEARLLFSDLIERNGPVSDLIDADYTFVDKYLAHLYRLPEKETLRLADGFQRVSLEDRKRGGVLGMAAVQTVSANGVDTSPVTRGVFVSENILGVTPPPPPDEVPAIDTDVRGATTIRERLAKHSDSKTCMECHHKIDPLGFPMEIFDPIGRHRVSYPKPKDSKEDAPKVDPAGEFPSGETFAGFTEFKKILRETRGDMFARHLVSEILAYSTGRHMEATDQYEIEEIRQALTESKGGLRDLVVAALTSEIFRSR